MGSLEVNCIYKKVQQKQLLKNCSLAVPKGSVVGLLGPNGAGKTTLFSIIAGLIFADQGTIMLDGQDISHYPAYRRGRLGLGYLPQEPSIFRGLNVEQNIMAILEMFVDNLEQRQQKLEELLVEFGVESIRYRSALALSGGERRRVEIARALAADPQYILMDEPLAGIDPIAVGDIRHLIIHLQQRGIGILITDHNVRDALTIVSQAYIIADGSVLMHGTPDEIINDEKVRRIYLGESFLR